MECVPASIAIRTAGRSVNHLSNSARVVRNRPRLYDFTFLVERAVMTPDIPKIDPDRHLDLGAAAWCFRDEVLRLLLHPHSLSLSRVTVLIPFFGKLSDAHLALAACGEKRRFLRPCVGDFDSFLTDADSCEDLLNNDGLGVGVILDIPPLLLAKASLVRAYRSRSAALLRSQSRNISMRSISGQPDENTCRLMSVTGPLNIRCSHQLGSLIRST